METAGRIAGARFSMLSGDLARLHRALIQFMLDMHTTRHGYTEVYVPYIVNATSLTGTGQLPKFAADLFRLEGDQEYYLAPTAKCRSLISPEIRSMTRRSWAMKDCASLRIPHVLGARRVVTAETPGFNSTASIREG